jgi:3-oxoadipate enol-lactonase
VRRQPSKEWTATVNGAGLRVEEAGAGEQAIVFSPPAFLDRQVFQPLVTALAGEYRCITYDHRGQGESGFGVPQAEPHLLGLEGLYGDAVALLDQLGVDSCHWVGASLGGFVGMRVAARHPARILSLTTIGPRMRPLPRPRLVAYRALGVALRASHPIGPLSSAVRGRVSDLVMRGLFGADFLLDPRYEQERQFWRQQVYSQMVPEGVPMLQEVFDFPGNGPEMLARIQSPVLVLVGDEDDVEGAREVVRAIPRARLQVIPGAGHIVLVEQPRAALDAIAGFLRGVGSDNPR